MENLKNIQPVEDFNWDSYEKGDSYGEKSKEELVKTYDETLNTVKDKEVVMGTVTAMNKREVVVNIGFKSDGVVPMSEFRYNPDLKVGDEVEVYIESQEDKKGQLILSHKKARATRSWDRVNEALEKDEIISLQGFYSSLNLSFIVCIVKSCSSVYYNSLQSCIMTNTTNKVDC